MSDAMEKIMAGNVSPLSAGVFTSMAGRLAVPARALQAIVNVESSGSGRDARGRVKVLFEKHRFYLNLPKERRAAAVAAGLARKAWVSPKNGGYKDQPNNDAALALLARAVAFDERAGLMSASYGLGQVMGENFKACGWSSVQQFAADMATSEDKQAEAVVGFVVGNGLADEIRALDFEAIARTYNGPGQVAVYAGRMRAEFARLSPASSADIADPVRAGGVRLGSTGYRVKALQARLNELGFTLKVDGDFGPSVRRAVLAFQAERGLVPDGVVGPETERALEDAAAPPASVRQLATVETLREDGSRIVKEADKTEGVAVVTAATAAVTGAAKVGLLDALPDMLKSVEGIAAYSEPLSQIAAIVAGNWWIFAGAAGVALFIYSRRIKAARLEDHQTGRTV